MYSVRNTHTLPRVRLRFPGWFVLLAGSVTFSVAGEAQVVRGRITDRTSGSPVPGVLVSLLPDAGTAATISVLSNARGEYAIRATSPGRYRLDAKRIGVQRFVSEAFELGPGESKSVDVMLDAVQRLPEVRVLDSDLCVTNQANRARVASLWDEARTVLIAAQISSSQRCKLARVRASSAPNGSSSSNSSRAASTVRAKATRWRIPPESAEGYSRSKPARPKSLKSARARSRASPRGTPCASNPAMALSSALRQGSSRSRCGI